jgi:hypothetical protein
MELTDEQKTTIRRIAVEAANTITKNLDFVTMGEFTNTIDYIYDYIVTGEYKKYDFTINHLPDL